MGKNVRRMLAVVVLALLMGPVTGSLVVNSDPVGWETKLSNSRFDTDLSNGLTHPPLAP